MGSQSQIVRWLVFLSSTMQRIGMVEKVIWDDVELAIHDTIMVIAFCRLGTAKTKTQSLFTTS